MTKTELTVKDEIKVLVCDNETDKGGLEALSSKGLNVSTCEKNGASALEAIKNLSPDVVVMDVYMPVLDAIGVMERAKNECVKSPAFICYDRF